VNREDHDVTSTEILEAPNAPKVPEAGFSRRDFLKMSGAGVAGAALLATPGVASAKTRPYVDFSEHRGGHFSRGRKRGVAVRNGVLRLSNPIRRGGRYLGILTSRPVRTSISFDTMIPSWEARTPPGTRIVVLVRVRYGDRWSNWMNVASYSAAGRSRSTSPAYGNWKVNVDTIQSRHGERAVAYQYQLRLISNRKSRTPVVRRFSTVASQVANHGKFIASGNLNRVYGKSLPVPRFSQYDYDRGAAWCSPTSMSMVLSYWSRRTNRRGWRRTPPQSAPRVYDAGARLWGNWPFNTGFAGHLGLESSVTRFNSLQQVERWIDKGIPVIASVAWDNRYRGRRLNNASIPRATYGHLMVIVGFTSRGDVIVNDSAASPRRAVRRVYDRGQFRRAWLNSDRWLGGRSDGVVYLVHPRRWSTPYNYASNGSW
jgi:hypothetical protein